MLPLSKQWCDFLIAQTETGMGYFIVTVTTKDGRRYPQAVIDSGYVTRARDFHAIPFRIEEIQSIDVTHDKWDWSKDQIL